jgi:hypothetical protein
MGDFEVTQRTSDAMFNATELLKQWNKSNELGKKLDHYFENKSTEEFINTIISKENLHARNSVYVKSRASRGENAGTWMNPILFIDFAMWINPSFKYDVLKFVYDELIKYRNEAGDAYHEMSEAVAKLSKKGEAAQNIAKVAEAINYIAQNDHAKMIRNKANENQMKEYVRIEKEISMLVTRGFIKNFNSLMDFLREEWKIKYVRVPNVLSA